jgi:cysteine-rich repeat protein
MKRLIVGTLIALAACGDNGGGADVPEIAGANLTTDEDAPITHSVEASDPKGLAIALTAQTPAHGTIAVDRLRVTYTPSPNYNGPDSFTVTASNGKTEVSAQIDVTVRPVNDAPAAVADAFSVNEDEALVRPLSALLGNDTDVDGDPLSVASVQGATNGTVSKTATDVTFTPATDFIGMASFQYTITDGKATATATATITIGGSNDPPVAVDDSATTPEDTALQLPASGLVANDTDPDGQTLSVTAVGSATHGTVALAGGVATFTPEANYSGAATFDYTVSDGTATDTGTVTITVTPVNDAPVAVDDAATTAEDTQLVIPAATLLANDTDVDGPSLSITQVGGATNGTVSLAGGTVTFLPAANYSGTASFTYTVSDGTAIATGTVTVTVTPVNDAPVAVADTASTPEDVQLVVPVATLLANDTDAEGDALSITQVGGATNGTVSLAGGNVTFRPTTNFNGTAGFTYTVTDGALTATGAVSVTVTSVNDAPVAVDDTAQVQSGNALVLPFATLLANDTDIDGQALTITAVQNTVNGTAVLGASAVTFTPDTGFVGTASFDYVVSDGTATDVGAVSITVQPGPVCGDGTIAGAEICDDGNTAPGDGCSAACAIEPGWSCTGEPSTCTTTCGDSITAGSEQCDDGNGVETDGCTTQCVTGALCTATALPGGDRFAVDPATGHCYAAFDDDMTPFAAAQSACAVAGGYLATVGSAGEQGLVHSVQNPAQNPWIGAGEDANTTDAIFDWVTDEPFGFTAFAPGQPDNDNGVGGGGDCLHLVNAAGQWNDTNCNITSFVIGRICEVEPQPCGDSVRQPTEECDDSNATGGDGCSATCQLEDGCGDGNVDAGEECDDNNINNGDGCSATCQLEDGCGDGNLDTGEQCDDDNTAGGDGCSATCQKELLATFSFTGAGGGEVSLPADGTAPAPGLASIPVISRGPGLTASAAANTFSAAAFAVTATIDLADYFSFTVTPAAGFSASLLGITLDERRSATGIRTWSVRSSLDGFTSDLATFTVPDDINTRLDQPVPLGLAFRGLTAPVEFRVYGFAAEAAAGTWRLDNIKINGFTTGP